MPYGSIALFTTTAILHEYSNVFARSTTDNRIPIKDSHRRQLAELLSYATTIKSDRHSSGKLFNLDQHIKDERDRKFVIAADQVANMMSRDAYLISEDHHITGMHDYLQTLGIIALTSDDFLNP